jgi:hypothetical protein
MNKQNCWEYKDCGREPGGTNANELGVCPASLAEDLDGIHGGINGGRSCWVCAGTHCEGKAYGTFAARILSCLDCDFYQTVVQEEEAQFMIATEILKKKKAP